MSHGHHQRERGRDRQKPGHSVLRWPFCPHWKEQLGTWTVRLCFCGRGREKWVAYTFPSSLEIEMPVFLQGLGSGLWNSNKKASSLSQGTPQPHTFAAAEPCWRWAPPGASWSTYFYSAVYFAHVFSAEPKTRWVRWNKSGHTDTKTTTRLTQPVSLRQLPPCGSGVRVSLPPLPPRPERSVEQLHPGPRPSGPREARGQRHGAPGGRRSRQEPPGFLVCWRLGRALPHLLSPLSISQKGAPADNEAVAGPPDPHPRSLSPAGPSAWYAPAERACAVRAGRHLCDSGAAILSARSCRAAALALRSRADSQTQIAVLPLAPVVASEDVPGSPGRRELSSSFGLSPSATVPAPLCPPPSLGATSAATRRRLLFLPLLPPSPLPPSPLPLSATISPLPGTGALS